MIKNKPLKTSYENHCPRCIVRRLFVINWEWGKFGSKFKIEKIQQRLFLNKFAGGLLCAHIQKLHFNDQF